MVSTYRKRGDNANDLTSANTVQTPTNLPHFPGVLALLPSSQGNDARWAIISVLAGSFGKVSLNGSLSHTASKSFISTLTPRNTKVWISLIRNFHSLLKLVCPQLVLAFFMLSSLLRAAYGTACTCGGSISLMWSSNAITVKARNPGAPRVRRTLHLSEWWG